MYGELKSSEKLYSYLPSFIVKTKDEKPTLIGNILNGCGLQLDNVYERLVDFQLQNYVDSATWALNIIENELGIKTDPSKTEAERRDIIKMKYRGCGKVDSKLIKSVAEACKNGDVEVYFETRTKVVDKSIYNVVKLKFNSIYGTPTYINSLIEALKDIIPAHLPIEYAFKYLIISEIHEKKTIAEMMNLLIDVFAGGTK